jgi:succinate-acetate transporter protein
MAQLTAETHREHVEVVQSDSAHAPPLGLCAFAFTTVHYVCQVALGHFP